MKINLLALMLICILLLFTYPVTGMVDLETDPDTLTPAHEFNELQTINDPNANENKYDAASQVKLTNELIDEFEIEFNYHQETTTRWDQTWTIINEDDCIQNYIPWHMANHALPILILLKRNLFITINQDQEPTQSPQPDAN